VKVKYFKVSHRCITTKFLNYLYIIDLDLFSSLRFSPDNKRLLYIAEKKIPKQESYYQQKSETKTKYDKFENEEESSRVRQ
jgi:hypothetical protein